MISREEYKKAKKIVKAYKKQLLMHDVVCSKLSYCEKKEIEQKVKDKLTGIMNWL
jgi:hypothetical protein